MIKSSTHAIKGIQRDLTVSKFNSEFAFDAQNIRITARNHNTLLSITNEKGNKEIILKDKNNSVVNLQGTVIGYNVLNNYLTLFTTDNTTDRIYRLKRKGNYFECITLYTGSLNFNTSYPIESIGVYENENIQKVYWIDGRNQARVINITAPSDIKSGWDNNSFNFVQELNLNEIITVSRNDDSSGVFASGVIQYAFTYYNMYGQESNIFYTTPLQYISFSSRGASPEEKVSNSFTITIKNPDPRFDYIRVYSIHRTSIDATPTVLNVVDIAISGTSDLVYVDNGTTGTTVDPTELLYVGGESIVPQTMTHKDNTLFLGNIKLKNKVVSKEIRDLLKACSISFQSRFLQKYSYPSGTYPYKNQLGESRSITGFHSNEWYRFGVQFQYKSGKWSEPVFICDKENGPIEDSPHETVYPTIETGYSRYISIPQATTYLNSSIVEKAVELGFVRVRGVVVFPTLSDSEVKCQGILCPTVYNIEDRYKNSPYAQSSWFSRPNLAFDIADTLQAEYYYVMNSHSSLDGVVVGDIYNYGADFPKIQLRFDGWDSQGRPKWNKISVSGIILNEGTLTKETGNGPNTITYSGLQEISLTDYTDLFSFSGKPSIDSKAAVITLDNSLVESNGTKTYLDTINKGAWAEFRHNYPIPSNWERNAEIQCIAGTPILPSNAKDLNEGDISYWVNNNKEYFAIDQSILTLHSPDIEFGDNLKNMDTTNLKLRIVGRVSMTSTSSDIDIQTDRGPISINYGGKYIEKIGTQNLDIHGLKSLITAPMYIDAGVAFKSLSGEPSSQQKKSLLGYFVYPWERNGSLNNDTTSTGDSAARTAVLTKKKLSNLKFCAYTSYLKSPWYAEVKDDNNHNGISGVAVFDSDNISIVRIPSQYSNGPDINYYGNVDKVVVPTRREEEYNIKYSAASYYRGGFNNSSIYTNGKEFKSIYHADPSEKLNKVNGYPIVVTAVDGTDSEDNNSNINLHSTFSGVGVPLSSFRIKGAAVSGDEPKYGSDPVSIKYKSTPHAVLALKQTSDHKQLILPTVSNNNNPVNGIYGSVDGYPWDKNLTGVHQDSILSLNYSGLDKENFDLYGFLWLAELYSDTVENRFGGNTEEAFENNLWLPSGNPVSLVDNDNTPKKSVDILYTEGDTFFQRYDCLKTYPYTMEDQNSVVEIVSFYCETRVNIDGRYDKNRGQTSNLIMTPTNFNLINPVYSQRNNFFSSRALNYNKYSLDYFPNTITWTKEKQAGAIVDTWTNVTMASTLDLDGDKGEVVSLNTFNNEVFCFQKQGFSNILFNSRVQIPTSDGVPIEISNGLKVDGKRYISNTIGCNNKWSITESPSGLYFIDNITSSIYLFNGQIGSLSDKLGFRQWTSENNSLEKWDPVGFKNFVTYYDKNNGDVYFVNNETALVYSELLGQFTSFMSYGQVPAMFNINSDFYAIQYGKVWEQFAGDYNMFFGYYYPYSVTFVSNADEPYDKIFNTIEFRADCWTKDNSGNEVLASGHTFDTLEVWNEYQKGVSRLNSLAAKPSPLKKKFRIWRANVPRANTDWNGVKANKMDRIRNTWAYVKLSMNKENTDRMEFHDMIVHYFV